MLNYFDVDGNPISLEEWAALCSDPSLKIVATDEIGFYRVSTVWLGLNHAFDSEAPPLIFETMIFPKGADGISYLEEYCERYSTREEALRGHERAIQEVLLICKSTDST